MKMPSGKVCCHKFLRAPCHLSIFIIFVVLLHILHRFPTVKNDLYDDWVDIVKQHSNTPEFVPRKNTVVCPKHFAEDCFDRRGRLNLRLNALPTIFPKNHQATKVLKTFFI